MNQPPTRHKRIIIKSQLHPLAGVGRQVNDRLRPQATVVARIADQILPVILLVLMDTVRIRHWFQCHRNAKIVSGDSGSAGGTSNVGPRSGWTTLAVWPLSPVQRTLAPECVLFGPAVGVPICINPYQLIQLSDESDDSKFSAR